ncbi:MAG: hypothetical protein ACRDQ0_21070, partial [Pseudonocardia sp.]
PTVSDLAAHLEHTVATFAGAGADTVVFQGPDEAPDPEPLIAALAAVTSGGGRNWSRDELYDR